MQIQVEVCDVCQEPGREVEHYKFALPGQRLRTVALCSEHGRLLKDFAGQLASRKQAIKRVMDMSEIEALRRPVEKPK